MKEELLQIANTSFSINAKDNDLLQVLSEKINELILHNFNKLISILYRADINEKKLNAILAENKNEDAGKLIALLFLERHLQKIQSREKYKNNNNFNSDEERW